MGDTPMTFPPAKKRPPVAGTMHKAFARQKEGAVTASSPPPPPPPPPPPRNVEFSVGLIPPPPPPPPKARAAGAPKPREENLFVEPKSPGPRPAGSSSASSSTQPQAVPPPAFWRGNAAKRRSRRSTRVELVSKGAEKVFGSRAWLSEPHMEDTAVTAVSEAPSSEEGAAADEECYEIETDVDDAADIEDRAATALSQDPLFEDPLSEFIDVASPEYDDGLSPPPATAVDDGSSPPPATVVDDVVCPPPATAVDDPTTIPAAHPKLTTSMRRRLRWKDRFGDIETVD
jgi:hypothetical protein